MVSLGLLGIVMAVVQAWCAASLLAGALTGRPGNRYPLLAGFVEEKGASDGGVEAFCRAGGG